MSYKEKSPIPIVEGGTNATSMATTDGTVYFDGTRLVTTATGTAGQLLTSNGTGVAPTYQNAPASGITTINGDTGSVTGSTVTIKSGNSTQNSGSSVLFSGSGTILTMNVTDANHNTIIGNAAGNGSITATFCTSLGDNCLAALTSGIENTAIGSYALNAVTSGENNCAFGVNSIQSITSGSYNCAIGQTSGINYTGAESSNILINNNGTVSESNVLRIGAGTGSGNKQLAKAFVSGINGNTVSNTLMVTINSSTDQLGVASIPSSGITTAAGDTGTATGSTVTWNANSNAGSTVKFSASGSTVDLLVTDAVLTNTIMGKSSGNGSITGTSNTGFGYDILPGLTSGSENSFFGRQAGLSVSDGGQNTGVGYQSLDNMVHGSYNAALGWQSGQQLGGGGSDSSNIMLNAAGTTGDNNTLRVGAGTGSGNQQLNKAFISGINGVTVAGPLVNISSGDQLGVGAITSDASGRVTNANQPAFRVYSSSTQTNATGDGTVATIAFDTVAYDQNSNWNTGTYTFTAPVTGVYMFCVSVFLTGVSVGTTANLIINTPSGGFVSPDLGATAIANASSQLAFNSTIMDKISSGGTVTFTVTISGGTKTVSIFANSNLTYAMGALIC